MCRKFNIKFSVEANLDIKDIVRYISEVLKEPNIATKTLEEIISKIEELKNTPYMYGIITDNYIKQYMIRKFVVRKYIVFYRIYTEDVYIIRILYGKRNYMDILKPD